jgi:3-(3-hydroxy-phenyl)propionate hydroxylase
VSTAPVLLTIQRSSLIQPLISLQRGAEVSGLDRALSPLTSMPVRLQARVAGDVQTFTGRAVLGCDGANSTIRQLAGVSMEDLGFTERWLVVDIRAGAGLGTWDGVEQVCDPARARHFHEGHQRPLSLGIPAA